VRRANFGGFPWVIVCAASNSLKMDRNYYYPTTHRNSFPLPSAWIRDIFPLRSSGSSDHRFVTDSLRSHNSPICFFLYLCSQSSHISTNPALTNCMWLTTKWHLSFSSWEHVFLEFLTWFTTPLQTVTTDNSSLIERDPSCVCIMLPAATGSCKDVISLPCFSAVT
jgi:hypothetical protein